jgi:hypothetical protein
MKLIYKACKLIYIHCFRLVFIGENFIEYFKDFYKIPDATLITGLLQPSTVLNERLQPSLK